ncbi:MAG: endonuclease III domain-containing protein [Deltaproteobacteria bacterium]|nr:endonuclease III domain-containing protein [Deltaproteobacteria bacterium]
MKPPHSYPIHTETGRRLMEMFELMLEHFGPQNWWPADGELEMMVGAVLTQNTNWKNVEKALRSLKDGGYLSLEGLDGLPAEELAQLIRPAGYYNIKAKRLKNLLRFLMDQYGSDLSLFLQDATRSLREGLLSVKGIGPETADSILLYAAHRPVFVIDAYTYRILYRHDMADDQAGYEELQDLFMDHLPEDAPLFNEFHALIVKTGKHYCKKRPLCAKCPLEAWRME